MEESSTRFREAVEKEWDIPMAQLIAVADTDRKAEDIARRGAQWMIGSYMNPHQGRRRNSLYHSTA